MEIYGRSEWKERSEKGIKKVKTNGRSEWKKRRNERSEKIWKWKEMEEVKIDERSKEK